MSGADPVGAILASATISDLPTVLTFVDFTVSPEALLTPGASYWLLASMPDTTATAYWWAADVPPAAYPVVVAYNGGVFALGSHTQPVMFTISAVPEPSTWLTVLVGFAAFGWAALRRPRRAPRRADQRSNNRQGAPQRPLAIS
jgi:hypothetical protein